MPKLTFTSVDFDTAKYPECIRENTVTVYWSNLVWAAITAGKAGANELSQHGMYSRHERLMRLHMIRMHLKESENNEFQHTNLYKSLDGSEKTAISYFMGLAMAKYLSGHCLTVPWVQHYDSYLKSNSQKLKGSRPDLIGMNPQTEWFVLEAKGRSEGIEKGLMEIALEQACRAQPINIINPVPIASIAYTKRGGILHATWKDPENESSAPGYTIDPLDFLEQYYAPIRNLINVEAADNEVSNKVVQLGSSTYSFTTHYFADLDFTIGLMDEPTKFYLETPNWYMPFRRIPKLNALIGESDGDSTVFIGPDGVYIKLGSSWDSANMQKEPTDRSED